MTQADPIVGPWEHDRCPNCLQSNSVPLLDGVQLCLACRHEWQPAHTSGPLDNATPAVDTTDAAPVFTIPEMPPELVLAAEIAKARDQFVGKTVLYWDENVEGTVTEVFDSGYCRVDFDGLELDLLPDEFSLVVDEEKIDDAVVAAIGAIDLQVAALAMRAAMETIVEDDGLRRLGLPPNGWVPADVDALPVVEHGVAYAVAVLATTYGITNTQLSDIAEMLEDAAAAAKGATGQ